jgi:hypothetical protein
VHRASSDGPGRVPAGKVSNELVHQVDWFTTLLRVAGANVPTDRQIDGIDMREFLLGTAEESGRDTVLCLQGNRLQAVKWRQWKLHLIDQNEADGTFAPYNGPHLHNLEWDPREEHNIVFPHGWVIHPIAAAVGAFLKTLATEPRSSREPRIPTRRRSPEISVPRNTSRSASSASSSPRSSKPTTSRPNHTTGSNTRPDEPNPQRWRRWAATESLMR